MSDKQFDQLVSMLIVLLVFLGIMTGLLFSIVRNTGDSKRSLEMVEQPSGHHDSVPLLVPHYQLASISGCQTQACWRRVRAARRWRLCVRRNGANYCTWRNRFRRLPASWRDWAIGTGQCESGNVPTKHNPSGIYHGAMQFSLGTWQSAGGVGDPHNVSIYEQWARAIRLAQRESKQHWPICGRR